MLKLDQNRLLIITQIYLAAPLALFLVNWFSWFYSVPVLLAFAYAFYKSVKDAPEAPKLCFSLKKLSLFLLTMLALSSLAFPQIWLGYTNDSMKHLAVLNDLIQNDWPVVYSNSERLIYYLGYYIIPAAAGKADASLALPVAFMWTWIGLSLSAFWFYRLSGGKFFHSVCFFILAGGLDILGVFSLDGFKLDNLENAVGGTLQYSSNLTAINWVPQHAISAWLGISVLLCSANFFRDAWIIAAIFFWSAFTAFGIGLVFILLALSRPEKIRSLDSSLPALATGMAMLISWYSSGYASGISWSFIGIDDIADYVMFLVSEILILLPFAWAGRENNLPRGVFSGIIIILLLVPLLRSSGNNDWCMRVSLPLLFVFYSRVAGGAVLFLQNRLKPLRNTAIAILLLMSSHALLLIAKGGRSFYSSALYGKHPQVRALAGNEAVRMLPEPKLYLGD